MKQRRMKLKELGYWLDDYLFKMYGGPNDVTLGFRNVKVDSIDESALFEYKMSELLVDA